MAARVTDLPDKTAAILWGDLFEVAVKRGCLGYLAQAGLLPGDVQLARWADTPVQFLHDHLYRELDLVDLGERARHSSTLDHLLFQGWALGWTVLRAALKGRPGYAWRTVGLLCPLNLRQRGHEADDAELGGAAEACWQALHVTGQPDSTWGKTGQPARADFLLHLHDGERHHVYALEFSANTPPLAEDFAESTPHLRELLTHARRLDARGVFTRIGAELQGEGFVFNPAIVSNLTAFTSQDKPLYKLCQGSSYGTRYVESLARLGSPLEPVTVHVVAVTNSGVEALVADRSDDRDPRWALMRTLGSAYRDAGKLDEDDPRALDGEIRVVRTEVVQALPSPLRAPVAEALAKSNPGSEFIVRLAETASGVLNPAESVNVERLVAGVDETDGVRALLDCEHPREVLGQVARAGQASLRDMHAETVRRLIRSAPRGQVTVLAAEGLPGIGKTTAVREALIGQPGGFLWLYASPRLVINDDVTRKVARHDDGTPTGVLTLTTSSRLIDGAQRWWRAEHPENRDVVTGAVAFDGVSDLERPRTSTLLVTRLEAATITGRHGGGSLRKKSVSEDTDIVHRRRVPGVQATLAQTARNVHEANPNFTRMVLATSIQGYRQVHPGTGATADTVANLAALFRYRADSEAGLRERQRLGSSIPTIVVMVDEIAGDPAGTPFVHALARWLHQQFLEPFEGQDDNPFRVVLVVADASLGNASVMERYLAHDHGAPEKVIVSPAACAQPFRVQAGYLRLGGYLMPALHVMADGFPAREVRLEYELRLTPVRRQAALDDVGATARAFIREQEGEHVRFRATQAIFQALSVLPAGQQIIFFAQDKLLLRLVQESLLNPSGLEQEQQALDTYDVVLREDEVAILDANTGTEDRERLMQWGVRDRQRVFLMTSSGARGVSFPLATTIIAVVPTFQVEAGFMEVAQLVYRGRGQTTDPSGTCVVDGDAFDRRLVLVMQDFVVTDDAIDERQWLRRTLDVLSALVLLRATLLTRMRGDAGLPGQSLAVVPVGRIGTDTVSTNLSQAVATFVRDGTIFLRDRVDPQQRALVNEAVTGVDHFFRRYRRRLHVPRGLETMTQPEHVRRLARAVVARQGPLLPRTEVARLPEEVYALGPVWLEACGDLHTDEGFEVQLDSPKDRAGLRTLTAQLARLGRDWRRFPLALSWAARDLLRILDRSEALREQSFAARYKSDRARRWVALPLDYATFCYVEGPHGRELRRPPEDEHPLWKEGLLRAVSAATMPTSVEPAIADYAEHPFLVVQTDSDPTGLERAFDSRYFMASTELNLLNTVLFAR